MPKLGSLELEVVGLLEGANASSVSDIQNRLKDKGHALAYTTVMTVLSRLYEKGLLRREKNGKQYVYSLAKKADSFRQGVLSKVYSALFQNDRLKPIATLIEQDDSLSTAELRELRKLVDAKLKGLEAKK
jgi:predicted transcriptional regulator